MRPNCAQNNSIGKPFVLRADWYSYIYSRKCHFISQHSMYTHHTYTNTLHVTHVFYVYTCIQYSITDTCAHRAANILLQAGPMVWNESELYVRVLLNNSWNILMRRLNNTSETNVILFLCKIPCHGQHLCTWIERENDVSNATEWLSLFRFIFPSRLCSLCYFATFALFVCRLQNNKCIANQLFIRCWIHIFYGQTLVAYRPW